MSKPSNRHHTVSALTATAQRMREQVGNNPFSLRMLAEVNRLSGDAEALDRMNSAQSPFDTPAAHTKKVATHARQFGKTTTAAINRANAAWREGLDDVQRRIAGKVNLTPNEYAREIRDRYIALAPYPERQGEFVTKMIDNNHGPELAALTKAPAILTDMDDARRAALEQAIIAKHAAPEVAEQEKLNELYETVLVAFSTANDLTNVLTDPNKLADIERKEAAALEAVDAFSRSGASE